MTSDRLNILVIMSDDHAQWAAGCYGNQELHTPTLDYLAQTGVRMENAFTPSPVCSPARASFFTGLFPSQHGIHDFLQTTNEEIGTHPWLQDEITLPQILMDGDYQCGFSGKWHCGQDDQAQPGFDYWFSVSRSFPYTAGNHVFSLNGDPHEASGYKTELITDHAVNYLRQRNHDKPFFLFVGYTGTHSPWEGHPERLVSQYRHATFHDIPVDTAYAFGRIAGETNPDIQHNPREHQAQYYAAVNHIDEGVGRLLDDLDAQGLRENTLVVYTADHGLNTGHHGIWGKGNGTRPYNMLEESIRVPMIFNAPGQLFEGQVRREFFDHCDLFETLLDFVGVSFERQKPYPGRSIRPTLAAARPVPGWKQVQIGEYGNLRMARGATHKLVCRYPDGSNELFDLSTDPRETTNIIAQQPAITAGLTGHIDAFFATYSDDVKNGLRVHELPKHNQVEYWRGIT